ncbi:MAG: (Fe-S)-binding protein [bacterium]|nr:(Fe-S)-binding protein [bacterium]
MNVKLFVPCFVDWLFPDAAWACVKLLERAGCTVRFDPRTTCCGQPAFNSGYPGEAAKVASQLIRLLSEDDLPVVIPSGSCTSMIEKHYAELPLSDNDRILWETLRGRVFEFTQFWVTQLHAPDLLTPFPGKLMLHRSCHGLREIAVTQYTEQILRSIPELELVESNDRDACCGFGGTFSVKFPELSVSMADAKIAKATEQKVEGIVAGDVSCLMHLSTRASKQANPLRFFYVAEVMAGRP